MTGESKTSQSREQLEQWKRAVSDLVDDVSCWATEKGWPVEREEKVVRDDDGQGPYTLPQLRIRTTDGVVLIVDPVGMSIQGARGRVDIEAFPSMNRFMLIRTDDGNWVLKTESGVKWPAAWSRATFHDISQALIEAA